MELNLSVLAKGMALTVIAVSVLFGLLALVKRMAKHQPHVATCPNCGVDYNCSAEHEACDPCWCGGK